MTMENALMNLDINYESEEPRVLGRKVHEVLEVQTRYSTWFPRMVEYGFEEGKDYWTLLNSVQRPDGVEMPKPSLNHLITLNMAIHLCMLQRTEKSKQVREYFIHILEEWNRPESVMSRALVLANKRLDYLKSQNIILLKENSELKPKAEHYDSVMNSEKLLDMKDTAKVLDFCEMVIYSTKKGIKKQKVKSIGRNRLFEILRDLGILMKDNRPYQSYVDLGYFKLVEVSVPREGKDLVFIVTYVKQKGLEFLRKTLLNEGYFPREKEEPFWDDEVLDKAKMIVKK